MTYTHAETPSSFSSTQPISFSKHATTMKSREMSSYSSSFVFWKVWNTTKASFFITTNHVGSIDRAFESRIHPSLQRRKELDANSLRDHPADLPQQTRRFSSLRPPSACATLRRRCQGLRQQACAAAVPFELSEQWIEKELAAPDARLTQSHTQSHKISVAAVKNLVAAILISEDDIENSLKAAQLLATNHLERAMAYGYFALMMHTT